MKVVMRIVVLSGWVLLLGSLSIHAEVYTAMGSAIEGVGIGDDSGQSVSLSADGLRMAIGSPLHADVGHVRVFEFTGGA